MNGFVELENYIKQFNELAIKDSLTGIFNRRYINERLPAEMIKSGVAQEPLMVNIRHYYRYLSFCCPGPV
jgi:PleD family two-component response regulator